MFASLFARVFALLFVTPFARIFMTPEEDRLYKSIEPEAPVESLSRLEPHRDVILRWRRDGRSYRRIQRTLAGNGITIAIATLHKFVARRSRARKAGSDVPQLPQNAVEHKPMGRQEENMQAHSSPERADDPRAAQREHMRKLKQQPVIQNGKPKIFDYGDEDCQKPFALIPDQPKDN